VKSFYDLTSIDWKLLREQKAELLALIPSTGVDSKLDGLVNFIDNLQDQAEACGIPDVFAPVVYTHTYVVAFSVRTDVADPDNVPAADLLSALQRRYGDLALSGTEIRKAAEYDGTQIREAAQYVKTHEEKQG
jgi:hypothetical protein